MEAYAEITYKPQYTYKLKDKKENSVATFRIRSSITN